MVKTTQRHLRKVPATSKSDNSINSIRINTRSRKKRNVDNCAVPETPQPTSDPLRLRKCVVKLKRINLQSKDSAFNKMVTASNFRNCTVRLYDVNKSHFEAQSPRAVRDITTSKVFDVSVFQPAGNSTVCKSNHPTGATILSRRNHTKPTTPMQHVQTEKAKADVHIPAKDENIHPCDKQAHRFFHRDQPATRTRSSVTRNVFEFLTNSAIEDNDVNPRKDPAADIIKKMVEEGRACVMKWSKKGNLRKRPVKKKLRPVGRRKQCTVRNVAEKLPSNDKESGQAHVPAHFKKPLSPIYEPEQDSSDDDNQPNEPMHVEAPAQVHTDPQRASINPNKSVIEGSYSPLARSLLVNQTTSQNPQERRLELLNMARKFISTPLNRKSTEINRANSTALSSITNHSGNKRVAQAAAVGSPSGGSSPWRVADEVSLPNTFMFGLNTSQLPSYSSDFVQRRHVYVPDIPDPGAENSLCSNESICPAVVSSRSSTINDSNGENVPPSTESDTDASSKPCLDKRVTRLEPSGQENTSVENLVQFPNPRRTLPHRSPLKDINILDVVVLPSWRKNVQLQKTLTTNNVAKTYVRFEENKADINQGYKTPTNPTIASTTRTEVQQQNSYNLFGFEEFICGDEQDCGNVGDKSQNVTLHEKLQRLKGLRPKDGELPQVSKAPMRHDYDDLAVHGPKQRNIREMLCSTMIAPPSPALAADKSTGLFNDADPEVTFDEKKPRRTYLRERPKRKRKQRIHVLFIDSDSSENEDNEQDSKDKSAESPHKMVPPQKRARKDLEQKVKLEKFIASFNQECAEVEKFPLIIE